MKLPEELYQAVVCTHISADAYESIVRDCADQVPMNWCDPLLTGPDAVIKDIDCRQVEALLTALKKRILSRYGLEPQ